MKVFTCSDVRRIDSYTIENEPVKSIDLMERAAEALTNMLLTRSGGEQVNFCLFAGPGNNGGDALALARKLKAKQYDVQVHLCATGKLSTDCEINKIRLQQEYPEILTEYSALFVSPHINEHTVIIDGLFGSGLSRPLSGLYADVVKFINGCENTVFAIDVPSGLNADICSNTFEHVVKADYTFSFQFPKPAFFFAENEKFVGRWFVLDIGLHKDGIRNIQTDYYYLDPEEIIKLIKKREKFSHKGSYGHLALLAGSKGMAGAAVLAGKAALRTGVGLLTLHGPECNRCVLQIAAPEIIYDADDNVDYSASFYLADKYDAIATGPGIGVNKITVKMLDEFLSALEKPSVLDADALNIIANRKEMLEKIPAGSILTPHPKEFERLFGATANSCDALRKAREIAVAYRIIVVLKGAYSRIVMPDGKVYFNSTGNSGMATAGSGDVLTGMLGSLLAQGYSPDDAAKLGVYLHGLAADLALDVESEESLTAGDIIANIGKAFKSVSNISLK